MANIITEILLPVFNSFGHRRFYQTQIYLKKKKKNKATSLKWMKEQKENKNIWDLRM